MKTLLITYLPSGAASKTKMLLDVFLAEIGNRPLEIVNLLQEYVPFFTEESMAAYRKRNYQGQTLDDKESKSLEVQDKLVKQFKSADIVVMAYPMHNFGMPGIVKTYLDALMFKGETFARDKKVMAGKKSLTLFTSGGAYTPDLVNLEYPNWDTLSLNAKINFGFMGFDETQVITASLSDPSKTQEQLNEAYKKIHSILDRWYKI